MPRVYKGNFCGNTSWYNVYREEYIKVHYQSIMLYFYEATKIRSVWNHREYAYTRVLKILIKNNIFDLLLSIPIKGTSARHANIWTIPFVTLIFLAGTEFDKDFDWKVLWRNLHSCPTASKIKDLQWKCTHNVIYTEFLLSKMGLSNGKCHFCVHHTETLDHLFFHCVKIQEFLKKVFTYMYHIIPGSHNFEFHIYNVMLGFDIDNDITFLCNLLLFTAKWVIWKERNLIKYQQKVNSVIKLYSRCSSIYW